MVVENKDGKGNPNHDDTTGEFTTSGGGGAKAPRRKTTYIDIDGKGEGCGYSVWRAKKRGDTTPPPPTPEPPKPEPPKEDVSNEEDAVLDNQLIKKFDQTRNKFEAYMMSSMHSLSKDEMKNVLENFDRMKNKADQVMLMHSIMQHKTKFRKTTENECSCFSSSKNTIALSDDIIYNTDYTHTKGNGIVHEAAHSLDFNLANDSFSRHFRDKSGFSLKNRIVNETQHLVQNGTYSNLKKIAYEEAETGIFEDKDFELTADSSNISKLKAKECYAYRYYGTLSDSFSYYESGGFLGFGHDSFLTILRVSTPTEFFAGCFADENTSNVNAIKKFLPKSYNTYLETKRTIKKEILKEMQNG